MGFFSSSHSLSLHRSFDKKNVGIFILIKYLLQLFCQATNTTQGQSNDASYFSFLAFSEILIRITAACSSPKAKFQHRHLFMLDSCDTMNMYTVHRQQYKCCTYIYTHTRARPLKYSVHIMASNVMWWMMTLIPPIHPQCYRLYMRMPSL